MVKTKKVKRIFKAKLFSTEEVKEIRKKIVEKVERFKIDADDGYWCSQKTDYHNHVCDGQDGCDISFTKKDYEKIWKRIIEIIKGGKK